MKNSQLSIRSSQSVKSTKSKTENLKNQQSLRSSVGFQNRRTPSSAPSEQRDEMTQSHVGSEQSKKNNLMKSIYDTTSLSSSPKKSSAHLQRCSSLVGKKLTSNMNAHDKTIIKMMGLNMVAICNNPTHEKSKISFICLFAECHAKSRLGCAHCFLSEHQTHSFDRINIQDFCEKFDVQFRRFKGITEELQQVGPQQKALVFKIQNEFQLFKRQVNEKLQEIEKKIISQIEEKITQQESWIDLQDEVEFLNRKTLFMMSNDELYQAVDFVKNRHINELLNIQKQTQTQLSAVESLVNQCWDQHLNQMKKELESFVKEFSQLLFPLQNKKAEAIRLMKELENKKLPLELQYAHQKEIVKGIEEQEQQILMQEKQKEMMIRQKQEEEEQKKIIEAEKQIKQAEAQKKEELKAQEDLKNLKLLQTFPYTIYDKNCKHTIKCNTIPIFNCCGRAYPCAVCHGTAAHPPAVTIPSLRYCMKCFEIYWTKYPTNQAVNCLKCLK